jgi:type III pantothenate kinase
MAWLLIDNSNSRTKFQLGDSDNLKDWRTVIPTSEMDSSTIGRLIKDIEFSGVVVASVVPEKEVLIREFFSEICPYHQVSSLSPLGYGFELESPEQIGHDRLSNIVALKCHYGAPGIAIDFGTAVTFSVLSAAGNFAGGTIAPGMECMSNYLSSRTAQLPAIEPEIISSAIGKTTAQAMQAGAVIGHRGMVREILQQLTIEIGEAPIVVATGGGAEFAAHGISEINKIDPHLTLEGLRLLAKRVF